MEIDKLNQRREKRIESRRVALSLEAANRALAERRLILNAFKVMPLIKLRAIYKAAQQAFNKP